MKKVFVILAALLPAIAQAQSLPGFPNNKILNAVPTVAALEALPDAEMLAGTQATVLGYAVSGDAPSANFVLTKAPCSLNSGAGDGGSQHPSASSGNCWVIAPNQSYDARQWGAVIYNSSSPVDASSALNAYLTYMSSTASGTGIARASLNGQAYGVSSPVTVPSDIRFEVDGELIPISGTNFNSSNGVLVIPSSSFTVTIDGGMIELNNVAGVNGIYNAATGNIRLSNNIIYDWTGGGSGLVNVGKWSVYNDSVEQWKSSNNACQSNPASCKSGYAIYESNLNDSYYVGGNYVGGTVPVYVADGVSYVRFIGLHTWPGFSNGTTVVPNAEDYEIHGNHTIITNAYLDSGDITIVVDQAGGTPADLVDDISGLYASSQYTFPAWVVLTTNQPGTTFGNFDFSNISLLNAGIPPLAFQVTGSGSWVDLPGASEQSILAAAVDSLSTTHQGLIFANAGTTNANVTYSLSGASAAWQNFADAGTTTTIVPQIGSQGNCLVGRAGGQTLFQGCNGGLGISFPNGLTTADPINSDTVTNGGNLNASHQVNGIIYMKGPVAAFSIGTNNAAALLAAAPNSIAANGTFWCVVKNTTAFTATLTAGTGVTLNTGDTFTIAAGSQRKLEYQVTNVATPAITVYSLGTQAN